MKLTDFKAFVLRRDKAGSLTFSPLVIENIDISHPSHPLHGLGLDLVVNCIESRGFNAGDITQLYRRTLDSEDFRLVEESLPFAGVTQWAMANITPEALLGPKLPAKLACSHSFVQNGMKNSWCKHCDVDAFWSDGRFVARGSK